MKNLLKGLVLYYLSVAVLFQVAIRLGNWRGGSKAFGEDEGRLLLLSATIPLIPRQANWSLIWAAIRHGNNWNNPNRLGNVDVGSKP